MADLRVIKDRLNSIPFCESVLIICSRCHSVSIGKGKVLESLSEKKRLVLETAVEELNNFEKRLSPDDYDDEGIDLTIFHFCDSCKLEIAKNLMNQVDWYDLFLIQCIKCNMIWINENQNNFQSITSKAQHSLTEAVRLFNKASPHSLYPDRLEQEVGFKNWTHSLCPICQTCLMEPKAIKEQLGKGYDQCFSRAVGNGKCPYEETDCYYKGFCREVGPEELQLWVERNRDFLVIPPHLLEKLL